MGSCVSIHRNSDSAMKFRLSIGSKTNGMAIPPSPIKDNNTPINAGGVFVKSQRSPSHLGIAPFPPSSSSWVCTSVIGFVLFFLFISVLLNCFCWVMNFDALESVLRKISLLFTPLIFTSKVMCDLKCLVLACPSDLTLIGFTSKPVSFSNWISYRIIAFWTYCLIGMIK